MMGAVVILMTSLVLLAFREDPGRHRLNPTLTAMDCPELVGISVVSECTFGRTAMCCWSDALAWAEGRLFPARRSTSRDRCKAFAGRLRRIGTWGGGLMTASTATGLWIGVCCLNGLERACDCVLRGLRPRLVSSICCAETHVPTSCDGRISPPPDEAALMQATHTPAA